MSAVTLELGRQSLADLCAMLNMPPPICDSNYSAYIRKTVSLVQSTSEEEMKQAAKRLRDPVMDAEHFDAPEDGILDVAVSFHGTSSKRGYTANFGIGVLMSVDTGEVLDFAVLSIKRTINASKTTTVPSPAMETFAAGLIWNRSVDKYQVRYRYMVRDGDSKSHTHVKNVSGPG